MIDFSRIKCLAYDFDGVMTDNRVIVNETGSESVFVNRGDGYAVSQFKKYGFKQIIISSEMNDVVSKRAEKLGILSVQGIEDKGVVLDEYADKEEISTYEVLYIGNDLNDIPAFEVVGICGCPADANDIIKKKCSWVSKYNGGYGVIRDLYNEYMMFIEKSAMR